MKTLDLEKMGNLQGGFGSDYCDIIRYWFFNNYNGYQGNPGTVNDLFVRYCWTNCSLPYVQ